jgi:two-component system, response regulator RegA
MKSLLLVDDDEFFRERLAKALRVRGYDVRTAPNAQEAQTVAEQFSPSRAVVDIKMPGEDGLELTRFLRERDPEIRVVILTGYGSIPSAMNAVRLGAKDYLTKPADADQIAAVLEGDPSAFSGSSSGSSPASLDRVEWEYIQRVLQDHSGNISQTARALGIHRRSLQRKLSKYPPSR